MEVTRKNVQEHKCFIYKQTINFILSSKIDFGGKNLAIVDQFAKVSSANLLLSLDFLCENAQSSNVFSAKHASGTNPPKLFNAKVFYRTV